MNINIQTKNMQLTPAIREYIEKKLFQIEKKLIKENSVAHCDVEVGKTTKHHMKGEVFRAEFNLSVDGKYYRTESTQENLYAAIDDAKDELQRTVRSNKNKKIDISRRSMLRIKNAIRGLRW